MQPSPKRGVPVYDADGAPLAPSVNEAARRLNTTVTILYARLREWRDGWRLTELPPPSMGKIGRPGVPVVDAEGRPVAPSVKDAAQALGLPNSTLRKRLHREGGVWVLEAARARLGEAPDGR